MKFNNNIIDELIRKHDIYLDDGTKNSIEEVESKQATEIHDCSERYKELELLKVYFYNLYVNEFKNKNLIEDKVYILLDDSIWDDESTTKVVAVSLDRDEVNKIAIDYINKVKSDIDFDNLEITDEEDSEYVLDSDKEGDFSIYLNGYYSGNHINISIIEKDLVIAKINESDNVLEY